MNCEWKEVALKDLGDIVGGATPSTKKEEYYNGDIPWITPKDLSLLTGRFIINGERNITKKGLESCSTQLLPKYSVLFSSRAPIGYIAINKVEVCTNQGFKSVVPNNNTNYMFLYYLLKYNKDNIESMGSGTTFKEVSGNVMKNIKVKVPTSLLTQQKIAKILSALDDKIELNNRINKNLEEQAQALFKSWFVDFEPFGGVMPGDWCCGQIKDLSTEIICGKTPSTKDEENFGSDIPFITIPDLYNNVYVIKTERYLSTRGANSQKNKFLPKNSICVSCIGTAGLVSLVYKTSQTNQQINSIIPKDWISPYFIYFTMLNMSNKINSYGQSGSTIVNMNKSQFEKLDIIIPNIEIMKDFNNHVKSHFDLILINQLQNEKIAQLRDTLLPKLMNGEIDVDKVEII